MKRIGDRRIREKCFGKIFRRIIICLSPVRAIGVSRQTVKELMLEKRSLSPKTALLLSRYFGNSPRVWLNAQQAVDLWEASRRIKRQLDRIAPREVA